MTVNFWHEQRKWIFNGLPVLSALVSTPCTCRLRLADFFIVWEFKMHVWAEMNCIFHF
jgi:hypothetical protein